MPFTNDPNIPDHEQLLRRVPPFQCVIDENTGLVRPSSAAFDETELSIDLASVLRQRNEPLTKTLEGHDGYALTAITAALARACNQAVCADALPDNPAHGIVFGKKTGSIRKRLYGGSIWIVPPQHAA